MSNLLKQAMLQELEVIRKENPKINWHKVTIWDIALSLFHNKDQVYLLTLKGDLEIIHKIAQGLSIASIANQLGITSLEVGQVGKTWGLIPLDKSLDFNAIMVYNRDIDPQVFLEDLNDIIPKPVGMEVVKQVLANIERYYDLLDFLKDEDE